MMLGLISYLQQCLYAQPFRNSRPQINYPRPALWPQSLFPPPQILEGSVMRQEKKGMDGIFYMASILPARRPPAKSMAEKT